MRARHSQKKRWFSNCDKSNSVVNGNELESKFVCRLFRNSFQLVLRHFTMCLVLDSLDFTAVFKPPHHSPKRDHRSCIAMIVFRRRLKWRFSYQNFTNDSRCPLISEVKCLRSGALVITLRVESSHVHQNASISTEGLCPR